MQNRRVNRILVFVALVPGLVASCSASSDFTCQPASSTYRELFQNASVTQGPIESDILVKNSAVPGAWYIVAKVDGPTPVWVTDRDPQGNVVGHIVAANRAAQQLSNNDFVDTPMSRSTLAQAVGDPDRVESAESCTAGWTWTGQTS